MVGGDVSRTVMRWTQVLRLPHSSVAAQVRSMTFTVAPGNTGGCGGSGPRGGCVCGGGSAVILEKFPIEMVLLPTVICAGGTVAVWAETSCAAMLPPT